MPELAELDLDKLEVKARAAQFIADQPANTPYGVWWKTFPPSVVLVLIAKARAAEAAMEFARNVVEQARGNVNDCRMDYLEIQVDKDEIDAFAERLGLPAIDWHPEPCKHPDTKWVK